MHYADPIFENDADTLGVNWGEIFGPAIGAGTQFGLSWLASQGQGGGGGQGVCGQTQISTDGAIAVCLDQVLITLPGWPDPTQPTAGITTATKLAAYEAGLAFMQNPQYFRQGASAHYLGNQIRRFRDDLIPELRRQLEAEIATGQTVVTTDPATGQPTLQPATGGGIDTKTLMIVGGGALVLMLLMKN